MHHLSASDSLDILITVEMGSEVIAMVAVYLRILENRVGKLEKPEFHPHPPKERKEKKIPDRQQPLTKYQKIRKILGLKINLCR